MGGYYIFMISHRSGQDNSLAVVSQFELAGVILSSLQAAKNLARGGTEYDLRKIPRQMKPGSE